MTNFILLLLVLAPSLFFGGIYYFSRNTKLYRIMQNTPTSKLRSASQGYVELAGKLIEPSTPIIAPASQRECSWWSCSIERYDGRDKNDKEKWVHVSSTSSNEPFLFDDGTDIGLIYPEGAIIKTPHKVKWSRKEPDELAKAFFINYIKPGELYRYTKQFLFPHDDFYILGELNTRNTKEQLTTTQDVIHQWRKDYPALIKRFDRNGNNLIDTSEWELVRLAAELESEDIRRKSSSQPLEHCIIKPKAGLPYILSAIPEESLINTYRLTLWASIVACLIGAIGLVYVITYIFIR